MSTVYPPLMPPRPTQHASGTPCWWVYQTSNLASTTFDDLASNQPQADRWFQKPSTGSTATGQAQYWALQQPQTIMPSSTTHTSPFKQPANQLVKLLWQPLAKRQKLPGATALNTFLGMAAGGSCTQQQQPTIGQFAHSQPHANAFKQHHKRHQQHRAAAATTNKALPNLVPAVAAATTKAPQGMSAAGLVVPLNANSSLHPTSPPAHSTAWGPLKQATAACRHCLLPATHSLHRHQPTTCLQSGQAGSTPAGTDLPTWRSQTWLS